MNRSIALAVLAITLVTGVACTRDYLANGKPAPKRKQAIGHCRAETRKKYPGINALHDDLGSAYYYLCLGQYRAHSIRK